MDPLISAQNINFVYNPGQDNEFKALINITVDIYPEEFVIIFGPSGCGKSTLLNIFAGLEKPMNGQLLIKGKDFSDMKRSEFVQYHRKDLGMIFQAYNLITSLTVLENVALPLLFFNTRKNDREQKAMNLLERFGIKPQAYKIPTELSGGQQQRIGIARAIVNNPDIILADEPVGNLDSVSARNVLEIMNELNTKEKKTVIMVTHNPENLEYGDRIIYMKDGMITRETINRQKNRKKVAANMARPPSSEIENLMRAYQGLTPEQINVLIMPYKAKLFAHHFITTRNLEETRVFEDILQRKLLNNINAEEFQKLLNLPESQGGVGFDARTAEKVSRRINRAIRLAYFIYRHAHQRKDESGQHPELTLDEKAEKAAEYLLKTCYYRFAGHLPEMAVLRLRQAVRDRLKAAINKNDFYRALDLPFKDGGIGLNSKTARSMTEELELVLVLGYGVAQGVNLAEPFSAQSLPSLGKKTESEAGNEDIFAALKSVGSSSADPAVNGPAPREAAEILDHPEEKKIDPVAQDPMSSDAGASLAPALASPDASATAAPVKPGPTDKT